MSRAGLKGLLYTGSMGYYAPVKKNGLNMYLLTWKDKHDTLRGKNRFHNIPLFKKNVEVDGNLKYGWVCVFTWKVSNGCTPNF